MKKISFALSLAGLAFALNSFAQTADVKIKDIPANPNTNQAPGDDEGTTIEIHKRSKMDTKMEWQITEGNDELAGDPAPLLKDARANWKKACADWKKEMKEDNKDNKVITLNCGSMNCVTAAMETTCKSTANHKIKVKVN